MRHTTTSIPPSRTSARKAPAMTALVDPLLRPVGFVPRSSAGHVRVHRPVARLARPVGTQSLATPRAGATPRHHGSQVGRVAYQRPVRLSAAVYRRRRRVVGLFLAIATLTVSLATVGGGAFASGSPDSGAAVRRTMVVSAGDTLWDIARSLRPEGAIGDLVSELVRLNGARLEPGQIVILP